MSIIEDNNEQMTRDLAFMDEALALAAKAAEGGDVPVGAVVVRDGEIIARGYNRRETAKMATAHAEILAIEEACKKLGGWRLPRAVMYVTLEPCPMCAGAAINARLERVVYGAHDLRFGALGSLFDLSAMPLNHKLEVTPAVMGEECASILTEYFRRKRKKKDNSDMLS